MNKIFGAALWGALFFLWGCDQNKPLELSNASDQMIQPHVAFDHASLLAREEAIVANFPKSSNALALAMYQELAKGHGNFVFSPFSVSHALAMSFAGAKNKTEAEFKKIAHFHDNTNAFHRAFGEFALLLANKNRAPHNTSVTIANLLWIQNDLSMVQHFSDILASAYRTRPVSIDFSSSNASQEINQTIETMSHNHIKNLLREPLPQSTRFVLTNALHFNSPWQFQFSPEHTTLDEFTLTDGHITEVAFMKKTRMLPYGEDEEKQFLLLPYLDKDFAALLVVPKEKDLWSLEKNFDGETFATMLSSLSRKNVNVWLPKFSERTRPNIKQALMDLGLRSAFHDKRADFSGMVELSSRGDTVCIDDLVHESVLSFYEEGTTSAPAPTVIKIKESSPAFTKPPRFKIFHADRPFMFLIIHQPSGTILFMGRIHEPRQNSQ